MAKKFVFKLAALKKFRANKLLLARKELIGVENKIYELSQSARRATQERSDLLGGDASGSTPMRLLYAQLVENETIRIRKLERDISELEIERDRHARWVTHLGRELKAIERLEEKKQEAHDSEQRLFEKRSVDSWVAERWPHAVKRAHENEGTGK